VCGTRKASDKDRKEEGSIASSSFQTTWVAVALIPFAAVIFI